MNSQHTPGPWQACEKWVCEENDPGHNVGICLCEQREEVHANARLIAAAPDMLAALKRCEQMVSGEDSTPPDWDLIRSVIAKAEGR